MKMKERRQSSIILDFSALWAIKNEDLAALSKSGLNFIKFENSEIFWIKTSNYATIIDKLDFYRIFNLLLKNCNFFVFDRSESCKNQGNRELSTFLHKHQIDENFVDFVLQFFDNTEKKKKVNLNVVLA